MFTALRDLFYNLFPHQPAGDLVDPLGALVPVTRRP